MRVSAQEYLTECGWVEVQGGWEHPSAPGVVRNVGDALIEQGGMQKPQPRRATNDRWGGYFDNER